MDIRFYFNIGLNLCADENWLIEYLRKYEDQFALYSEEEIREELRTCHEVCGWYECEVSNTIEEALRYG
jgi:hypothetical protein